VKGTYGKGKAMKEMRNIVTCIALAVALAAPIAGKAADHEDSGDDSPTITVETTHDEGVGWLVTLNHARCGAIPTDFGDINPIDRAPTDPLGARLAQTTTTEQSGGRRQIERIELVTGMAEDSHDERYVWSYENHRLYDVPKGN
jgi:Ni/Co efflux regulator RcnB